MIENQLVNQAGSLMGVQGAEAIETILDSVDRRPGQRVAAHYRRCGVVILRRVRCVHAVAGCDEHHLEC